MNSKDIKTIEDVIMWLAFYIEWNDEASRDCAIAALEILRKYK